MTDAQIAAVVRERDVYRDALQYILEMRLEDGYKVTFLRVRTFVRTILERTPNPESRST